MGATPKWKDAFKAAENKDLEAVKYFVENGEDVLRATDGNGRSVASIAARNNDFPTLKFALETDGFVLQQSDYSGHSIIESAIDKGALDTVKYLVEHHKWDVHHRNKPSFGNTPIHHAAKKGQLEILKYLIEEKGGDVDTRNDLGDPPVFLAAEKPYMTIIRYLVEERKADLKATNTRKENILYVAAKKGDTRVMQYVLDERKTPLDVNWTDELHYTVLQVAVRQNKPRVIKYLVVDKHADVNIVDDQKRSPLHIAAFGDNGPVCKFLVEHGANLQAKDKLGYTPTDNANDEKLINYLKEQAHERIPRSVDLLMASFAERALPDDAFERPNWKIGNEPSSAVNSLNNFISNEPFNFLVVMDAVVRYVRSSPVRRESKRAWVLPSPLESVQERIDPMAVDSVNIAPR
jgi:ankyrin repeat protein